MNKKIKKYLDEIAKTEKKIADLQQYLRSFPNKRILRNNLCLPACKQKNIATKLRDTA